MGRLFVQCVSLQLLLNGACESFFHILHILEVNDAGTDVVTNVVGNPSTTIGGKGKAEDADDDGDSLL